MVTEIPLSNKLKGDIGELFFEHCCQIHGYAYIGLEDIYRTFTPQNTLIFRYGYQRIKVKVPDELVQEIREFSVPSNKNDDDPSFTLDYLTVALKHKPDFPARAFTWVDVKTGKAILTKNQKALIERETSIPIHIYHIKTELPKEIIMVKEDPKKLDFKR